MDQTVEKLEGILQAKGVKVFALIDHSGTGPERPSSRPGIGGDPAATGSVVPFLESHRRTDIAGAAGHSRGACLRRQKFF